MPTALCRSTCLLLLIVGGTLAGCNSAPQWNAARQFGVSETALGRDEVEQAILLANLVLPPDEQLRLQPTWELGGFFPPQEFNADRWHGGFRITITDDHGFHHKVVFTNSETLPVYLIDGESLGNVEVAFVPDGCRCVFVNAHSIDNLSKRLFLVGPDAFEQHNSFDKSLALALVLLHEMGHIRFGDTGSYAYSARLDLSEINKPSQAISNPEVRADAFASEVVRLAWASGEIQSALPGPYGRAEIASNIFRVIETGFNSYDYLNDPQGIMHGKIRYSVFQQKSYSHLNLYLRLLIFLQQSEPTEERLHYLTLISQAMNTNQTQ